MPTVDQALAPVVICLAAPAPCSRSQRAKHSRWCHVLVIYSGSHGIMHVNTRCSHHMCRSKLRYHLMQLIATAQRSHVFVTGHDSGDRVHNVRTSQPRTRHRTKHCPSPGATIDSAAQKAEARQRRRSCYVLCDCCFTTAVMAYVHHYALKWHTASQQAPYPGGVLRFC